MSATQIVIEEESGIYTGRRHPHNGYYAGDFWGDGHRTAGQGRHNPGDLTGATAATHAHARQR